MKAPPRSVNHDVSKAVSAFVRERMDYYRDLAEAFKVWDIGH